MKKNSTLQSPLARARGMGASHHAVGHWWYQRVTALALIPLSVWFLSSLIAVAGSHDPFKVVDWLSSPWHALPMVALIVATFWHAKLGLQVVVEDYVHCPVAKYTLLLANNFFCWGAGIACVMAVVKLHMFSLVSGY